jgi:integrase
MSFLSATLGRIAPRFRTLSEWSSIYFQIIESRPLTKKTLMNRRCAIMHIIGHLGGRPIGSIRPHEIAQTVRIVHEKAPVMGQHVLIEIRDMLNEAMNYGWIDRNPATDIKQLPAPVSRQRLTLEQWLAMRDAARKHRVPWIVHMLELALVTGQRRSDLRQMQFDHVYDDHLHIDQQKTGARIALPLALRLDIIGLTLGDTIDACRHYGNSGPYMLRSRYRAWQRPLNPQCLSNRFELIRDKVGITVERGTLPSLHECRSLAERLYREQGIDTRTLMGHKRQSMTDQYNDDRGLSRGTWRVLKLP